jgi:crotonobetainyl-CoA:carnitine CoA-transferase CaiB-like acyl-CoA transferase
MEAMEQHIRSYQNFEALTAALDRLNLAWGEVFPFGPEVYEQPSVKENGVVVDVTDDEGNPRRTIQSPYRFSNMKSGINADSKTAKRGEHNVAALRDWLDMDEKEISALTESKALIS